MKSSPWNSMSRRWGIDSLDMAKEENVPKESINRSNELGGGAKQIKPKNKRITDKQRH